MCRSPIVAGQAPDGRSDGPYQILPSVTDRYSGYRWLSVPDRQAFGCHFKRDFQEIADVGGDAAPVGGALLVCAAELSARCHRVKEGTLQLSSLRTQVSGLRLRVRDLLTDGTMFSDGEVVGMCRQILKVEPALWAFVWVEGAQRTNSVTEQSLRHGVIRRRPSFGTHSSAGSEFVDRILSVVATLRLQGRNVLEHGAEACRAAPSGAPAPALLPAPVHPIALVAWSST